MDTSIHDKLLPGEEILWEGQPQGSGKINPSSIATSIFGVFWLGFSLFWTTAAFLGTRNIETTDATGSMFRIFFPLFGLPFVAIGIFMVFVLPARQRNKNKLTYYYVTDKRVIINVNTPKSPAFNSIFTRDLKNIQITKNRDNTGNIIFGSFSASSRYTTTANTINTINSSRSYTSSFPGSCFYRIYNADDVYKLILMRQELDDLNDNND